MKKIDMHSHVGKFGGWAGFDSDIDTLIKFMDEYEVEKTVLCSADANTNDDTLAAYEKYPDSVFPVVFLKIPEELLQTVPFVSRKCFYTACPNLLHNKYEFHHWVIIK